MRNIFLFTFIGISLTACATAYKPNSFFNDGGFSETELQENIFKVAFRGNEFTNKDKVIDFTMLRAAEICSSRNMKYMIISNTSTESISTGYLPATINSNSYGMINSYGANSNYSSNTNTIINPAVNLFDTKSNLFVQCLNEKVANSWDAEFLSRSLKSKYKIPD